jgi:hypothetical protein
VYTLAPSSATAHIDDTLSNDTTEPSATNPPTTFNSSRYNEYFDGENINDQLSEKHQNVNVKCCEAQNSLNCLNVSLREYRAALKYVFF